MECRGGFPVAYQDIANKPGFRNSNQGVQEIHPVFFEKQHLLAIVSLCHSNCYRYTHQQTHINKTKFPYHEIKKPIFAFYTPTRDIQQVYQPQTPSSLVKWPQEGVLFAIGGIIQYSRIQNMVFSLDNIFIYGTISPIICDILHIVTKYSVEGRWPKSYFSEMG